MYLHFLIVAYSRIQNEPNKNPTALTQFNVRIETRKILRRRNYIKRVFIVLTAMQ